MTKSRSESHLSFSDKDKNHKMLEGKTKVRETDMQLKMQIQAMSSASEALDLYDGWCLVFQGFDKVYGNGWQCVLGSILGVFSPIHLGLSSILLWSHLIFLSVRETLHENR
ncbi:hypothetical protein Lal_00026939, partial [Lupinus albus]